MQDKPPCCTAGTQSKTSTTSFHPTQAGTDRLQLLRTLSIQVLGISKHLLPNRTNLRPVTALQVCFLDSVFLFLTSTAFPQQKWQLEKGEMGKRDDWYKSLSGKSLHLVWSCICKVSPLWAHHLMSLNCAGWSITMELIFLYTVAPMPWYPTLLLQSSY